MLDQELFDLLKGTADAAFVVTREGEICSWNAAAERLFGYTAKEALHKTCYELLHGRGALGTPVCEAHCDIWRAASHSENVANFDLEVMTQGGRRFWVNLSSIIYRNSRTGRSLIVHLARDISEQKAREGMLQKMIEMSRAVAQMPETPGNLPPVSPLSEHEIEILRLFAQGKNSAEIAKTQGITLPTLRNHLHHINLKLRTHNRLEAVTHAIQRKLL
ncbi:MAG TPA: PAS domain S-box protein [Terriglobales bacterium]|nr:PAS domain S-box protein [Terriglobales bacterium]